MIGVEGTDWWYFIEAEISCHFVQSVFPVLSTNSLVQHCTK